MQDGFRVHRLDAVEIAGYLTRERVIVPVARPTAPDVERAAAEARSAAILGDLADREPA
jgi:hypothetical protein